MGVVVVGLLMIPGTICTTFLAREKGRGGVCDFGLCLFLHSNFSPREREDGVRDEGRALCDGDGAVGFTLVLGVVASALRFQVQCNIRALRTPHF
jgi:hypothetical protein